MNGKPKAKLTMMVIILGLIVAANTYFKGSVFLYFFDTVSFASIIVLLFGIKKDTGTRATKQEQKKIFFGLMALVIATTLILTQFIPKPYVYGTDLIGIILVWNLYRGFNEIE